MATVAVYRFDESGSVTRAGSVGTEPSLAVNFGAFPDDTGKLGQAAKTPGGFTNNSLETVSIGTLAGLRSFTFSFWIKNLDNSGMGGCQLALQGAGGAVSMNFMNPGASGIHVVVQDTSTFVSTSSFAGPAVDTWQHRVVSWNNATSTLNYYLDGSLAESVSGEAEISEDWEVLKFAAPFANSAAIDQLEITDQAEDATWVASRYNSGAGFDPTAESPSPPDAPTDLAATDIATTSLTLTWTDNSDDESGFNIEYRESGGTYAGLWGPATDETSYDVTGLSPGTSYDFRIKAYNINGDSDWDELLNVSTLSDAVAGRARLLLGVG